MKHNQLYRNIIQAAHQSFSHLPYARMNSILAVVRYSTPFLLGVFQHLLPTRNSYTVGVQLLFPANREIKSSF